MKLMLYLFLDKNKLKLLYVKKTLLGQYESAFYGKKHAVDFLDGNGKVASVDVLASAIREATSSITPSGVKDKDTYLILPQPSFHFLRTEVPADIAPGAISSFVQDKLKASLPKDVEQYFFDYLTQDNEKQKQIILYAIDRETLNAFQEALTLVDLSLSNIIPESLAYFKLFEKTLRKEKKENILYVEYEKDELTGFLFDSFGPLEDKKWQEILKEKPSVEDILKKKLGAYGETGKKINRVILSGENSDTVRQDTFTKNVGVWTNPLKRIILHFYQDYLKIFIIPSDKTLPLLQHDVTIGAFIFALENKKFSMLKKRFGSFPSPSRFMPSLNISKREILLFAGSFLLSFATLLALSKLNTGSLIPKTLPTFFTTQPIATSTPIPPTPTPTIVINKKDIKIKVLNGTGETGKAGQIKELLKTFGYEEILTGNADNTDYERTEIHVKKDRKHIVDTLKKDLEDNVVDPKVLTLDEEEASDVTITFGTDFK